MADTLEHKLEHWSRVGHGSRFRLRLPARPRGGVARRRATVAPRAISPAPRALLIDNDKATLEALSRLLAGWGFEVIALEDPTELLDGRWPVHPSVAIMLVDQHLGPRPSRHERRAARLRAMLKRDVPAIIVTADHSRDDRDRCRGDPLRDGAETSEARAIALAAVAPAARHGHVAGMSTITGVGRLIIEAFRSSRHRQDRA